MRSLLRRTRPGLHPQSNTLGCTPGCTPSCTLYLLGGAPYQNLVTEQTRTRHIYYMGGSHLFLRIKNHPMYQGCKQASRFDRQGPQGVCHDWPSHHLSVALLSAASPSRARQATSQSSCHDVGTSRPLVAQMSALRGNKRLASRVDHNK